MFEHGWGFLLLGGLGQAFQDFGQPAVRAGAAQHVIELAAALGRVVLGMLADYQRAHVLRQPGADGEHPRFEFGRSGRFGGGSFHLICIGNGVRFVKNLIALAMNSPRLSHLVDYKRQELAIKLGFETKALLLVLLKREATRMVGPTMTLEEAENYLTIEYERELQQQWHRHGVDPDTQYYPIENLGEV